MKTIKEVKVSEIEFNQLEDLKQSSHSIFFIDYPGLPFPQLIKERKEKLGKAEEKVNEEEKVVEEKVAEEKVVEQKVEEEKVVPAQVVKAERRNKPTSAEVGKQRSGRKILAKDRSKHKEKKINNK